MDSAVDRVRKGDMNLAVRTDADDWTNLKRAMLLVLGLLSGLVWLSYSIDTPGVYLRPPPAFPPEILRSLRFLLPLSVGIFSSRRSLRHLVSSLDGLLITFTFLVVPLISLAVYPDHDFAYSAVAPVLLTGAGIIAMIGLDRTSFTTYLYGVGFSAIVFLIVGVFVFGFETSTNYLRPRLHLGMAHPLDTSSMILAATVGMILFVNCFSQRPLAPSLARFMTSLILLSFFYLIHLADSRNVEASFLVASIAFVVAWMLNQYHRSIATRARDNGETLLWYLASGLKVLIIIGSIMPIMLYVACFAMRSHLTDIPPVFHRFYAYGIEMNSIIKSIYTNGGLGPAVEALTQTHRRIVTFSSVESVYLSYMKAFGFWGILPLLIMLTRAGVRLINNPVGLAIWSGIIVFYTFDAQGLTSSNLIVVCLLTLVLRNASESVRSENRVRSV